MATKTKTDQVKVALERLLRDEETQGQLRTAVTRLREAKSRADGRKPSKAVSDKKLYAKVREAATALTEAGSSLRSQPKPKRGRKLVLLAGAVGAAVLALKKRGSGGQQPPTHA